MTREEEIKATLKEYTVEYHCPVRGFKPANDDIRYLLARNEELQRRVEKMQAGLEMILTRKMSMAADYNHLLRQIYQIARNALDAKEQDDEATD